MKRNARDAYVVVIDPRRTRSARAADLHIQPNPSTDAALALGMINLIFFADRHNESWLKSTPSAGASCASAPPNIRSSASPRSPDSRNRHRRARPALDGRANSLVKFNDGIQRAQKGGQTIRALLALPAVTGHYGKPGAGAFYSQSSAIVWDGEALGKSSECPPQPRIVNMNRLGAALTGEITNPPIKSLYVFIANPVTSTPNSARVIRGILREDLFTVVHEQFMTDTARFADIVLPATSQLEVDDIVKPSGHRHIHFNKAAMAPLGKRAATGMSSGKSPRQWVSPKAGSIRPNSKSRARSSTPQTNQSPTSPASTSTSWSTKAGSRIPTLRLHPPSTGPNLDFGTPSGKIELYSEADHTARSRSAT